MTDRQHRELMKALATLFLQEQKLVAHDKTDLVIKKEFPSILDNRDYSLRDLLNDYVKYLQEIKVAI